MNQINPRFGNDLNAFTLTGIVRYGFRRYNTFKNKKPYLLFLLQQPYKTKDGKDRFKGYQILCFNPEYAESLFALKQQVYVRVKGNVSVETYTKDDAPRTVIKLLANEIEIVDKLMLPFIAPKSEQEKGVPKEIYEHTTVFVRPKDPEPSKEALNPTDIDLDELDRAIQRQKLEREKNAKPLEDMTLEEINNELGKLK
jgi:hypothetical protein